MPSGLRERIALALKMTEPPTPPEAAPQRRAYSYVRFSTPEQAKGDSYRRQRAAAVAYCATHGLTLVDDRAYEDLGTSAFRGANVAETGGLGQFLWAVEDGKVPRGSVLLVENLDRVSRQIPRKAVRTLESIVEAGIDVVTLSDSKLYSAKTLDEDPFALVMAVLTFVRANEESRTKATRGREAWKQKRSTADTTPLTKLAPAWLRLTDGGTWEVIADRAAVVRDIFASSLQGVGYGAIAKRLNESGAQPWGRGTHWHRSYVHKILQNPAVTGLFQPHVMVIGADGQERREPTGEPLPHYYPTVVDPDTFAQAQTMRATDGRTSAKGNVVNNLVAGIARCEKCGSSMTRVMKGKRAPRARLVCRKKLDGAGCEGVRVFQDEVEEEVWRIVKAADLEGDSMFAGGIGVDLEAADADLKEAERVAGLIADELLQTPSALLRQRLQEAEAGVLRCQQHMDELIAKVQMAEMPPERVLLELRKLDPEANRREANALLRRIVQRVVIGETGLTVHWKSGAKTDAPLWGSRT